LHEGNSRFVLIAPNWLGDAVMALPAIRDVRRHFSTAHLTIAARSTVASLFRAVPGIDRIEVLKSPDTSTPLQGDVGILFPNSFRSAWLLKRAGIKERWGYRSDFRGPLLTKAIRRPKGKVHFGEYYQNLVRELGIETGPLTPQLEVPPAKIEAAAKLLQDRGWRVGQPLVGLAPGAAFGHAKRWAPERFGALASSLIHDIGAVCVLLGRDEDRQAAQETEAVVAPDASKGLMNLVGRTDLLMLMGVLSHCRALVAGDSGALHLAGALGVAVIGIYGPTDERYSWPLPSIEGGKNRVATISEPVFCRPCFLRECPIDHRCMKRIPTERVYTTVRQLLDLQREPHA
jgi:lipopolysaccharide heptosyltransferase II